MTEVVDIANDTAMRNTQASIDAARAQAKIVHGNHCKYCGERTKQRNFCDADCRDDYEYEQRRLNG